MSGETGAAGGGSCSLSAQALVAALQAKVQVDLGALGAGDPSAQAVLVPLLGILQQAQDAMAAYGLEAAVAAAAVAALAPAPVPGQGVPPPVIPAPAAGSAAVETPVPPGEVQGAFHTSEVQAAERSGPY